MKSGQGVETDRGSLVLIEQRGAVLMEAMLGIAFALFMLISIVDLLRIAYVYAALSYVSQDTARFASFGPGESEAERVQLIEARALRLARTFILPLHAEDIRLCPLSYEECPASAVADPQEFQLLHLQLSLRVVALLGQRINLHVESAVANEPF